MPTHGKDGLREKSENRESAVWCAVPSLTLALIESYNIYPEGKTEPSCTGI